MQDKELIINKNNELLSIKNRKEYTKLTLNCDVNPKLLFGFTNIKELTVDNPKVDKNNFNESNINSYPFIENLEKINFINISNLGIKEKPKKQREYGNCYYDYYRLKSPSLKSINFSYTERPQYGEVYIFNFYLNNCRNLEEIIFNITDDIYLYKSICCPSSLKKIIIKFLDKEYVINFEYVPSHINKLSFDKSAKKFYIIYSNNLIDTEIEIDIITDKKIEDHTLTKLNDSLIKDNNLYIPDYISKINFSYDKDYLNKIEHISFNIKLLSKIKEKTSITDNNYLNIIKTITLRNDKKMSLFPNKTINVKDYGIMEDLYIENNKLHIVYDNFVLIVNEEGIIKQEEKIIPEEKKEIKEEPKTINLDEYSIEELESYLQYRKLLETYKDNEDKELISAINIVGDKIVKKLTK